MKSGAFMICNSAANFHKAIAGIPRPKAPAKRLRRMAGPQGECNFIKIPPQDKLSLPKVFGPKAFFALAQFFA